MTAMTPTPGEGSTRWRSAGVAAVRHEDLSFEVLGLDTTGDADLAWAALPEVAMRLWGESASGLGGGRATSSAFVRNLGRAVHPNAGPTLTRVGPVLVVDTSRQTTQVIVPVVTELARRHGSSSAFRLPTLKPNSIVGASRRARRVERCINAAASSARLGTTALLRAELLKVEILRRRFENVGLRNHGIRAMVVASQQNSSVRAALSIAHQEGIMTYYIPHAPTADNQIYRDLPSNYALIRGPEEVNIYRDLGAEPTDRLVAVGNPGIEGGSMSNPPDSTDVVYAPSTHQIGVLQADIAVILEGCDYPIKVALHPLMDSSTYRDLLPGEWEVVSTSDTYSYLRQHGAKVVIQHGSGVALDALTLGVDVIDLCHGGEQPNYHFMREPFVQVVADGTQLRQAIDAVPGRIEGRAGRIEYARSWCSDDGHAALQIADAIESTHSTGGGPAGMLLDGWGPLTMGKA